VSLRAGRTVVRLATRGSPLALAQAVIAARRLEAGHPGLDVEPVVVRTEGDRRGAEPLEQIGGQGLFVKEVQAAVLDRRADAAVHSAKDLPPVTPEGLVLAAVLARADPRDALVGAALDELRPGAVVATGSARRRAQLANLRPDLVFVGLRGNMATRLQRADNGTVAAVVAAAAALDRLGMGERTAERLSPLTCLPQVGQGALALECRSDDVPTQELLASVDVREDHRSLDAERAFLRALGAGCAFAAGALARATGEGYLGIEGMLASGDGRVVVRARITGEDPDALGRALARLLVCDRGASSIPEWEQSRGTGWEHEAARDAAHPRPSEGRA
jgi:hydroxymethylbilane synthase